MRKLGLSLAVAACALTATAGAQAVVAPPFQTVMTGLDNPRGLALGPDGSLYVAEAGRGGTAPCGVGPAGAPEFAGPTGAISRLRDGVQQRIVTGLPSHAGADGTAALGPHDIAFGGFGFAHFSIGWGNDPALRTACQPLGPMFGWLAGLSANGSTQLETDLAAYEAAANPDHGQPDSDPYGLLAEPGSIVATDAGGNSLLRVGPDGSVSTLATFPSRAQGRSTDSVPTAVVAAGRSESSTDAGDGAEAADDNDHRSNDDGAALGGSSGNAYYVGELSGAPFVPGQANVYRVVPGEAPTVFVSGFSFIIDLAVAGDGSLYVLEFATGSGLTGPGDLWRVSPDGTTRTLVATGFVAPGSVAVGGDGALYVSNCSIFPGTGSFPCNGNVVRITP
jgi:hypothetical protein